MSAAISRRSHRIRRPLFGTENVHGTPKPHTKWIPSANVTGNAAAYTIRLAVPGLTRDCFSIHVKANELMVTGRKEGLAESPEKACYEYDYSAWQRSFFLPEDADTALAQASCQNGELIIIIPRNQTTIEGGESDVFIY